MCSCACRKHSLFKHFLTYSKSCCEHTFLKVTGNNKFKYEYLAKNSMVLKIRENVKDITKIICIAVNDPNVMKAWGENQNVNNKILMLGDPFLKFTKAIGAEVDKSAKGLGIRSNRYTMLVEKGLVKKIEEEKETATCNLSAAESFLNSI